MADFSRLQNLLGVKEVLEAYKIVSEPYPYVPSVALWRSWESAAYQRYTLDEPASDIGCGDGRFFRLVWLSARDVIGIDLDSGIAELARASGIYREVHVVRAHELPFESNSFASAFANCSLEHMDHVSDILTNISRCLRSRGIFLLSIVTTKLLEWATLPLLLRVVGEPARAEKLQSEYIKYHHMVNVFSPQAWADQLSEAGLVIEGYIPIVPELTARLFLFLDHIWHIPTGGGKAGDALQRISESWPNFGQGTEEILSGFLDMERDWNSCAGAVFCARKRG